MNMISLNPSSIVRALGITVCFLTLAHIGTQLLTHWTEYDRIYGLVPLFNFDKERNIPTGFSTFLLILSSFLLTIIAKLKREKADPFRLYWRILAACFGFMAVDEAFSFHERLLGSTMRNLLGDDRLGIFYFAWVIPGIALVFILALFFLRFLIHLSGQTRRAFLTAATLYIGGAIGFEMVGGYFIERYGQNLTYGLIVAFEEGLEMAGLITFIWALMVYISDNYKEVHFRFEHVSNKKYERRALKLFK